MGENPYKIGESMESWRDVKARSAEWSKQPKPLFKISELSILQ